MYLYKYLRHIKKRVRKLFSVPLPASVITHLKNNVVQIVDVGAGGRPIGVLLPYAKNIDMYLCEPDPESARKLRERQHPWRTTTIIEKAISDKNGTSTFYVTRSPSLGSLLKPDAKVISTYEFYDHYGNPANSDFDIMQEIPIETVTLQSVIDEYHLTPYLLKLDTQGTEISILKSTDLSQVQVILTEIDFAPIYEGQNLFDEVNDHLTSLGFTLHKKTKFTGDVRKEGKRVAVGGDASYYRA